MSPQKVLVTLLALNLLAAAIPARAEEIALPEKDRWTELPKNLRYVAFSKNNIPWFESADKATIEEIKTDVEKSRGLKAPVIPGVFILLFDSHDRLWLLPRDQTDTLLCYDLNKNQWTQRTSWHNPKDPHQNDRHRFRGNALESKNGIIYITGDRGVYTLDGETWNYEPFFPVNARPANKDYNHLYLVDSPGGVYAWPAWSFDPYDGRWNKELSPLYYGCWYHDGKTWQRRFDNLDTNKELVNKIAPLGRDYLAVNFGLDPKLRFIFASGPAMTDQVQLALKRFEDPSKTVRDAAEQTLEKMDAPILPYVRNAYEKTTDGELKARYQALIDVLQASSGDLLDSWRLTGVRPLGSDADHNVYLRTESAVGSDGTKSALTFFRVSPNGKLSRLSDPVAKALQPAPVIMPGGRSLDPEVLGKGVHLMPTKAGHTYVMSPEGLARIDGDKVTLLGSAQENSFSEVLGEDNQGRLYLNFPFKNAFATGALHPDGRLAILNPRVADTRAALALDSYRVSNFFFPFMRDTQGRIWAQHFGTETPALSCFENGAWKDFPLPKVDPPLKEIMFLQPMLHGHMLATCTHSDAVLLLSDNKWRVFPTIDELVETEFAMLQKELTNETRTLCQILRKDAQGNIWVPQDDARVFTGKEWLALADVADQPIEHFGGIQPAGGNQMLISGDAKKPNDPNPAVTLRYLAEVKDGQISITRDENLKGIVIGHLNGIRVDSHNRTWISTSSQKVAWFDAKGRHEVNGLPMQAHLEDHAGRMWFINVFTKKFSVLLPDGNLAEFAEPGIFTQSTLAQDKPGSLWMTTSRGLIHFAVAEENAKISVKQLAEYTVNIPRGGALAVDNAGNLWLRHDNDLLRLNLNQKLP